MHLEKQGNNRYAKSSGPGREPIVDSRLDQRMEACLKRLARRRVVEDDLRELPPLILRDKFMHHIVGV